MEAEDAACELAANADARARVNEIFRRLTTLEPAALGAEELMPEELPFLRFEAAAQECFDAWRGDLEQTLRAEEDHPVLLSHVAKYRSLMKPFDADVLLATIEAARRRMAAGG